MRRAPHFLFNEYCMSQWETLSEHPELQPDLEDQQEFMLKPLLQGTTSLARRRSFKPSSTYSRIADGGKNVHEKRLGMLESNCMHSFRRSMLVSGALPFMHWGEQDIESRALHFEHQPDVQQHHKVKFHKRSKVLHQGQAKHEDSSATQRKLTNPHNQQEHHKVHVGGHQQNGNKKGGKSIPSLAKKLSTSWLPGGGKKRRKHQHSEEPRRGRPNVVVTHHSDSLEVRSLKNGRSLCHLTLWQD